MNLTDEFVYRLDKNKDFAYSYDHELGPHTSYLGKVAFNCRMAQLADEVPPKNLPSVDLMRRSPHFYAYNPNKKSYTRKVQGKVISRFNYFKPEQACVIFK